MAYKLICFDVDNTLAPINGPVAESTKTKIQSLMDAGIQVLLISGKPTIYLAGMVRQLGLDGIMVAGGNGEVGYSDHFFPPEFVIEMGLTIEEKLLLSEVTKSVIKEVDGRIWLQPNLYQLTIFHYENDGVIEEVRSVLQKVLRVTDPLGIMKVYEHVDCFDVLPVKLSKGNMVKKIAHHLGYELSEVIAVGDGQNDVSMFDIVGHSVGINTSDSIQVDAWHGSIDAGVDDIMANHMGNVVSIEHLKAE